MYRYTLYIGEGVAEAFPLETHKLKKVTAREKDQIFFREKLTGSLVFHEADFELLRLVEESELRCTEIKIKIEKRCSLVWESWWNGYFSCNDVKWSLSKCTATVTPFPDDAYRAILENYGKEFNILPSTKAITASAKIDFTADFEFILTNYEESPRENTDTWAEFILMNYWVDPAVRYLGRGGHFNAKIWFRMVRTLRRIDGEPQDLTQAGWTVISEDIGADTAKYAKKPDLYNFTPYDWNSERHFNYFPDLIQVPCGTVYDETQYINVTALLPEAQRVGNCMDLFVKFNEQRMVMILWKFGTFSFNRNRSLNNVIRFLVDATAGSDLLPANNLELSNFFNAGINYVTERPNTLNGLQLATISDIIGYNSSEPATRADWSLKKLLDSLRSMFRVFWDIDATGKIRIEHESFYQLQGVKDLTVFEKQLRGTNAYEYNKMNMPRYQRLLFQNWNNEDFWKGVIEYGGVCVTKEEGQDTEEQTITDITTDLEYLIVSGGNTGQKGFVLMAVKDGTVIRERGDWTGQTISNGGLSAANLVKDYYTHNRVLENGVVNAIPRTFKSVLKSKKQVTLTVPICCDFVNPYARFISTLSDNAELESMSYSLSGSVEVVLLHDTKGQGLPVLGRQFNESFNDSFR